MRCLPYGKLHQCAACGIWQDVAFATDDGQTWCSSHLPIEGRTRDEQHALLQTLMVEAA